MKIAIVTGSRAEYGLLRPLIKLFHESLDFELQLLVTGMHLSPEFGLTINEIKKDAYPIKKEIEVLLSSDTSVGISKSIGLGIISFSEVFQDIKPELVILLGDRYEIFSAAVAAMASRLPLAHIHGGEITEGAIDEAIRHSITKMSHLHFVATEDYKKRILQLGEQSKYVFNVGALGIENIKKTKLIEKNVLEKEMNFKFGERSFIVTFHPTTLEPKDSRLQVSNLLDALSKQKNTNIIFTYPNADSEGRIFIQMINEFCKNHPNAKAFPSLGQVKYFSCIKYVDAVLGNSSSGIIEVPSFKKGTINIGNRQKGRLKSSSIIDSSCDSNDICRAIDKLFSLDFQITLNKVDNIYGAGDTSYKIFNIIKNLDFKNILKKKFNDI